MRALASRKSNFNLSVFCDRRYHSIIIINVKSNGIAGISRDGTLPLGIPLCSVFQSQGFFVVGLEIKLRLRIRNNCFNNQMSLGLPSSGYITDVG